MQVDPRLGEITDCLYRISVKAVIINKKKILLVKEEGDEFWSLPGGGVDHGESDIQALKRELSEELGVSEEEIQTDGRVIFVTIGAISKGIPKANLFYRVDISPQNIRPTKHVVESSWFTINELPRLYLSPSTGGATELIAALKKQLAMS